MFVFVHKHKGKFLAFGYFARTHTCNLVGYDCAVLVYTGQQVPLAVCQSEQEAFGVHNVKFALISVNRYAFLHNDVAFAVDVKQ